MKPLSPFTYTRRHKRRTLMLMTLIALAVMGVYLLVGLMRSSYIMPDYTIGRYLSKFSVVQPDRPDDALFARIRAHPDVAQVLPYKNISLMVPNIGGLVFEFSLFGVQAEDIETVLERSNVRLSAGNLPQPGTNGVAISEEIAAALNLELGDNFDESTDDDYVFPYFEGIISPLEVVGILAGDVRLGLMSHEFLAQSQTYAGIAQNGWLVIPQPGRMSSVDAFLRDEISTIRVEVATYSLLKEIIADRHSGLHALFVPIILLVTAGVTLVIGAINQLAFIKRLPEIGTLNALGYNTGWLVRRLTLETTIVAVAGWLLGLGASLAGMAALNAAIYTPAGFPLEVFQSMGIVLVLPIPLAVVGFTVYTSLRALGRMDAVAIVERGQLTLEGQQFKRAVRSQMNAMPRPLAATTFYRRHLRRAITLIGAMALMIVGTALLIFFFQAIMNSGRPTVNILREVSLITPNDTPLTTQETDEIRQHPTVERVIPAMRIVPFWLLIPFIRDNSPLDTFAVSHEDMNYLITLYGLELQEGRLPEPNSSEIVIPWTAAKNRGLQVGDTIGDADHPVYDGAPVLPAVLTVSGIFAPGQNLTDEAWLGFMSLEFVSAQQDEWNVMPSLLIAPVPGQRAALDAWLATEIASEQRTVETHNSQQEWFQEASKVGLLALTLMESIIALVAALALAGLNYVFIMQRQIEFGVLSALGFNRRQLVWRATRETVLITTFAWAVGLVGCTGVLLHLNYNVYAPVGFRLDFLDPTPWLYTLPIPIAVLGVSAGAVAWILTRLDPVAVIERQ